MKNLINKVLVVLTVSALFAGNVDASQGRAAKGRPAKETAKKAAPVAADLTKGQIAVARAMQFGPSPLAKYNTEERNDDIKAMKEELKGTKNEAADKVLVAKINKGLLAKTEEEKNAEFKSGGEALNACKALSAILAANAATDAVEEYKANPTTENATLVAEKTQDATTKSTVANEELAGWKAWDTRKTRVMAAIGLGAVIVATFVYINGVPLALAPYVTPVTSRISSMAKFAYEKTGNLAEAIGLGETGYIGSAIRSPRTLYRYLRGSKLTADAGSAAVVGAAGVGGAAIVNAAITPAKK